MKQFTGYITEDGQVHHTFKDAQRYAEKRYGDALTRLAHILCKTEGRYSAILECVDEHLSSFVALQKFKDDCNYAPIDGESEEIGE